MSEREPDFVLTDSDFTKVRLLVKAKAGIDLGEGKRSLVYGRLSRRLRALGLTSFSEYLEVVEDPSSDESVAFLNAITTNVTAFYRESHHFDFLRDKVLPRLWESNAATKRIRIWSAGCSTGPEPYTIAMTILESAPRAGWDIKILATDIDTNVLTTAHQGAYSADHIRGIPASNLQRFFTKDETGGAAAYTARPELRNLITFKQLNLLGPWQMKGPFDVVFCRNVIIYFTPETRVELVKRFQKLTRPDGHIFLGHSESMVGQQVGMRSIGKTIYSNAQVADRGELRP